MEDTTQHTVAEKIELVVGLENMDGVRQRQQEDLASHAPRYWVI
ncbi:hypothetical protein F441_03743 [Phytophthora nicotianae CJ01A1]|uniref:Uncharacterized protein n=4 Tax=Phytophthora nicotianae TaxID=4792 RepID=W2QNU2_PHYN3|nr:hypothetical protein PPTG_22273 [Phytophthora nicotianae INRA-310]ETK93099.1 hypothetical protein L915_03659 [Phytophthora nicotianae]ETO81930.1 hypothetical protein F444_03831 [Phytophthora nicotianae P1976]ETP23057.1 hypothetical protein F441_03743 [Phytophthora nicotianae CJ01A1]ETL46522.1 hypothetical protein L916_03599 [Phytophthora nicotianae]ETL99658.1 hypothetical protein L917_03518 [Phytophthora nicotianae]